MQRLALKNWAAKSRTPKDRSKPRLRIAVRAVARQAETHPILAVLLCGLIFGLPALALGFPNGHDTKYHLLWHLHFAAQFWQGEAYPRWLNGITWGHGGGIFYYYPPLGFYVSAVAAKLAAIDPLGRAALGMATALALMLSGAAAYMWLRAGHTARAALFGAVLYMAIPYHLAIDLYLRTAYGELWAFVWMPLVLLCVRRAVAGSSAAAIGLALAYAGLILSHMPTTLLFSPFAGIYGLVLAGWRPPALARMAAGFSAGAALSAIYLLPAMGYQKLGNPEFLWIGFSYAFSPEVIQEKLASPDSPSMFENFGFHILLHCSFLMVALLIRATLFARPMLSRPGRHEFTFWLAAAAVIYFMVTPLSEFVWDLIPVLKKVQFSWRLHAILCLAVAALCAAAIDTLPRTFERRGRDTWGSFNLYLAGMVVIFFGSFANPVRFDAEEARERFDESSSMIALSVPRSAAHLFPPMEPLEDVLKRRFKTAGPRVRVTSGKAKARITAWTGRRIALNIDAARPATLIVRQFHFPLWEARRNGKCCLEIEANPADALMRIALPKGRYKLDLILTKGPLERAGEWISAATLAGLAAFAVVIFVRRRARPGQP